MTAPPGDTVFDPLLDEDAIIELLNTHPPGTLHPRPDGVHLVDKDGKKYPKLEDHAYTSVGRIDDAMYKAIRLVKVPEFVNSEKLTGLREMMDEYTIVVALPGTCGGFPVSREHRHNILMCGSPRIPNFFDFWLANPTTMNYYSSTDSLPCWKHSGDIVGTLVDPGNPDDKKPFFIHTESLTDNLQKETMWAVGACGFSNSRLVDFGPADPCFLIFDHAKKKMYLTAWSLAAADVGRAHAFAPLLISVDENGFLKWMVPNHSLIDPTQEIDTGTYTPVMKGFVARAANSFAQNWQEQNEAQQQSALQQEETHVSSKQSVVAKSVKVSSVPTDSSISTKTIIMIQDGQKWDESNIQYLKDVQFVGFGKTLTFGEPGSLPQLASQPTLILPIIGGGTIEGPAAAVGKQCTTAPPGMNSSSELRDILQKVPLAVVHVNEQGWFDNVIQTIRWRLNALVIIHITTKLSSDEIERSHQLNEMSFCVRIFGSLSLVLVHDTSNTYYVYRGPLAFWQPLVPIDARFPDKVGEGEDFSTNRLMAWAKESKTIFTLNCPRVTPSNYKSVMCGDKLITNDDFVTWLQSINTIDALDSERRNIEAVFAQIQPQLSADEIEALRTKLRTHVVHMVNTIEKPLVDKRVELSAVIKANLLKLSDECTTEVVLSSNSKDDNIKALDRLKGEIRSINRRVVWLLTLVEGLCSEKLTSKRAASKLQVERQMAIAQNVKHAKSLSNSDLATLFCDHTSGALVAQVQNDEKVLGLLHAISGGSTENYLRVVGDNFHTLSDDLLCPPSNCISFCPETLEVLLDLEEGHHMLQIDKSATKVTFEHQGRSAIIMPLFNLAEEVLSQDFCDWPQLTQEKNTAALRILTRGALSNLVSRISIDVMSQELTRGLQLLYLSTLHGLTRNMHLDRLTYESSICVAARGLVYLWATTAASGKNPTSNAWQMIQSGRKQIELPKTDGDWTIYALIVMLYPYTCLQTKYLFMNVRRLVVKAIRHALVDKVTEPMRNQINAMKAEAAKDGMTSRNEALQWNKAVCKNLIDSDPDTPNHLTTGQLIEAAKVLLQHQPSKPTSTTSFLVNTLKLASSDTTVSHINWQLVREKIAATTAKRSGAFAPHKEKACAAEKEQGNGVAKTKMDKAIDGFSKKLKVDPTKFHVQNLDAYNGDIGKMMGDAEKNRLPWLVSPHDLPAGTSYQELIDKVMSKIGQGESSKAATSSTLAVAKPDSPMDILLAELAQNPAGGKAIKMIQDIESLVRPSTIPAKPFSLLMQSIGIKEEMIDTVVRRIVVIHVSHYNDVVRGDNEAMRLL